MRVVQFLVGVSWIIFWIYWFASAHNSKPNVRGGRLGNPWLRVFVLIVILILLRIPQTRHIDWGRVISSGHPWLRALGVFIFYGSLALAIWARKNLGRNWGMPMSVKKDPQLVTSGPYAYIRHPIYTGMIFAALGTLLVESIAWLVVLIAAGGYFVYTSIQEDKLMAKQFPKTYPAYKARTKMLIPYIL